MGLLTNSMTGRPKGSSPFCKELKDWTDAWNAKIKQEWIADTNCMVIVGSKSLLVAVMVVSLMFSFHQRHISR